MRIRPFVLLQLLGVLIVPTMQAEKYWVYFGTSAEHIYVASFDDADGTLSQAQEAATVARPGFLEIHPDGEHLYAVGRVAGDAGAQGFTAAYEIDRGDGSIRELNRLVTPGGGAAHIGINSSGKIAAVANYGGASTVSMTIGGDGRLGAVVSTVEHTGSSVHPQRQREPHPHSANFTPDDRFVVVPDLGTDDLVVYEVSESGALTRSDELTTKIAAGSGPRHMTFHPNGRWAYVINEIASTVSLLSYESGALSHLQTISTLPAEYSGPNSTTAEVLVHPNGRFVYGSNRGDNTLAVFAIDSASGKLSETQRVSTGGSTPRNFRLSPSGKFLLAANQRSNDVFVFSVDGETGKLSATGARIEMTAPICVRFVPAE